MIKGQLLRLAAFCGHHVDVEVAVVLAGEGDPLSVGRKFGEQFAARMRGDAARHSAIARNQPQISAVVEGNLVPVNIGEAHQPAFGHVLRRAVRRMRGPGIATARNLRKDM